MRWRLPVVAALALSIAVGCTEPTAAPEAEATADLPAFAVDRISFRFTFPNEPTETYIDCLGETLLWYGTFDVIWTEKTMPNGNWVASWKLDYFDTDEVTWLLGEDSEVVWQLDKAENQGTGWVTKDKGPVSIQHFQSNEWYYNGDGDRLHIRLWGRWMYDAEGDPKMERSVAWGNCHPA